MSEKIDSTTTPTYIPTPSHYRDDATKEAFLEIRETLKPLHIYAAVVVRKLEETVDPISFPGAIESLGPGVTQTYKNIEEELQGMPRSAILVAAGRAAYEAYNRESLDEIDDPDKRQTQAAILELNREILLAQLAPEDRAIVLGVAA